MPVYEINPLEDKRWDDLVAWHSLAGVFHSRAWLQALLQTYGYSPIVLTTSAPGEPLQNGVVFCEVKSWITGRRLVSLPFSDHCELLADSQAQQEILAHVHDLTRKQESKYVELRPLKLSEPVLPSSVNFQPSEKFYLHTLSLQPAPDTLFSNMHKDCIQRKVRRAEREGLSYEKGRSDSLLSQFYLLLMRTRRRHSLPPQPLEWFRNLVAAMGEGLMIRVASKDATPVAALLTLSFRNTVTYKYGCSDERFNALGGMPFLFWKTIEEAREQGMQHLDLGRSDTHNEGLATFKDRLGAVRGQLTYFRCWSHRPMPDTRPVWVTQFANQLFSHLPDAALAASGKILYRHIG